MSISTTRGGGQSDSNPRLTRRRPRSMKSDRAITAAHRFGVPLPSYHTRDIYRALEAAGVEWNAALQQWEPVLHV